MTLAAVDLAAPDDPNPPGWDLLEYRGYRGEVTLDAAAGYFSGHVVNMRPDGVTFIADSVGGLREALKDSVDDYLQYCRERGKEPNPPLPGPCGEPYLTHLPYHACRAIREAAHRAGQSVGEWVADRAAEAVADPAEPHRPPPDSSRPHPQATAHA